MTTLVGDLFSGAGEIANPGEIEEMELLRLSRALFGESVPKVSIQLFTVCVSTLFTPDLGVFWPGTGGL